MVTFLEEWDTLKIIKSEYMAFDGVSHFVPLLPFKKNKTPKSNLYRLINLVSNLRH